MTLSAPSFDLIALTIGGPEMIPMFPGSPVPRAKMTVMSVQHLPPLTPFSELPEPLAQLAPLFAFPPVVPPVLFPAEPVLVGTTSVAVGVAVD